MSIYARALSHIEVVELLDNPEGRYEHHHTNALGSNIVLTDEGKNVIARYEYDVFGAVRSEVGTGDNPRKFTGKEYESDVKLYYFAARYYDPYIGRFTQRDPIGDGVNWYVYAHNNPLSLIDPTGLISRSPTKREYATLAEAAAFSFGEDNATLLMDFVTIKFATRDEAVTAVGDISAHGSYDSGTNIMKIYVNDIDNYMVDLNVKRLGTFVHELTHAWQHMTGYQPFSGAGYAHTREELYNLELSDEQMARAVQQHYVAMHWAAPGRFANVAFEWWMSYTGQGPTQTPLSQADLKDIASSGLYAPLTNMIRSPILKATILGGIKGGQ